MLQNKLKKQLLLVEKQLKLLGIKKESVCIVGSFVLAINNIRENRDIDLLIHPKIRKTIINKKKAVKISEHIEIVGREWASSIDLSDELIISNSKFYNRIEGFKIIKPEILFLVALFRRREKDIRDVNLLEQYSLHTKKWNWDLIRNVIPITNQGDIIYKTKSNKRKFSNIKQLGSINSSLQNQLIIKLPTASLLNYQVKNNKFFHYDILLHYLTIVSMMKKNGKRKSFLNSQIENKMIKYYSENDFSNLIKSFKKNGFLSRYPISIKNDGEIIDGSYRMACALYFDIQEVPIIIQQSKEKRFFDEKWCQKQNFNKKLLTELNLIKDELFRKFGLWYWITLWPPVSPWFDEITKKLSKFNIKWERSLNLGKSLPYFIRQIYSVDDIEKWKIELKISAMKNLEPNVHIIAIELSSDKFRLKNDVHAYQSETTVALKKLIREKYRGKIPKYFYDIIMHTGDNHEHNKKIYELLKKLKYLPNDN